MPVYTHGGDILTAQAAYGGEVLDFSANLNPLGMPAPVAEAARQAVDQSACYPDPCAGTCGGPLPPMTELGRSRWCAATAPPT